MGLQFRQKAGNLLKGIRQIQKTKSNWYLQKLETIP